MEGLGSDDFMMAGMTIYGTTKSAEAARHRRFFNVMADDVETVSSFLCEKALASKVDSPRIVWLNKPRIVSKLFTGPLPATGLFCMNGCAPSVTLTGRTLQE
jgi:hypothetical protein